MNTRRLIGKGFVLSLALLVALGGVVSVAAMPGVDREPAGVADDGAVASAQIVNGPIIADHTVVDKYDDIPQEYIDEVKKMWLNVPGESHSSGYRIGLQLLEDLAPTYAVSVTESGDPEGYTDHHLRVSRAVRSQYNSWGYGAGERTWYTWLAWEPSHPSYPADEAVKLKNHLTYANTNGLEIAAMGFGWCWDTTWHNGPGGTTDPVYQVQWAGSSVGGPDGDQRWGLDAGDQPLTGNRVSMDTYISATQEYIDHCTTNGYSTQVFFTTGPAEGGGESGYQRYLKHERLRAHVLARSDAILFDYADILSWSNAGEENTSTWTDRGGTLQTFPRIHSDNMLQLNGSPHVEDGDHIGERGALRLGKALWWLLARLAGWDGNPIQAEAEKIASDITPAQGETLTYTIAMRNISSTANLTDQVPMGLAYVPGTLAATVGTVNDASAPTLAWSGDLSVTHAVTLTYAVTVTVATPQVISNTATIVAPGYSTLMPTVTIIANGYDVYLPLVMREE